MQQLEPKMATEVKNICDQFRTDISCKNTCSEHKKTTVRKRGRECTNLGIRVDTTGWQVLFGVVKVNVRPRYDSVCISKIDYSCTVMFYSLQYSQKRQFRRGLKGPAELRF